MWSGATATFPEDMSESEELRAALLRFYSGWDPYLGHREDWAPDYCQRKGGPRFDREPGRFLSPSAPCDAPGTFRDPEAIPRPPGPPQADEEAAYAAARAPVCPLPDPVPKPPDPPVLTAAQMDRIAANREEARKRRRARREAARLEQHKRDAPWVYQPGFGFSGPG